MLLVLQALCAVHSGQQQKSLKILLWACLKLRLKHCVVWVTELPQMAHKKESAYRMPNIVLAWKKPQTTHIDPIFRTVETPDSQ